MNICILSREYPPETGWGGIGNYTYRLSQGLSKLGARVHIIAQSLDTDKEYIDGNVYVHRVAHKTMFPVKRCFQEFCLRLEYSQSVYRKLKEVVRTCNIDIVEAPNFSAEGFVYSLFKTTPLVTRLHTHFSEVIEFSHWRKNLDRRLSCRLEDAAIARSDLVTCSTAAHAETIAREAGVKKENIRIIPLGVPVPEIEKQEKQNKKNSAVLFVGRLEERKGAHILARAIPHLLKHRPDVHFYLAGRDTFVNSDAITLAGEGKASFKNRLLNDIPRHCHNNVHFLGHVADDELAGLYRACDLFVAPSLYESFGLVYIEAMSFGKPVIGCGVGGVPEVVEDGVSGLLVTPEDHLALAQGMLTLLNDRELSRKIGENARKRVENNFTDVLMAERTLAAYSNVLQRSGVNADIGTGITAGKMNWRGCCAKTCRDVC